MTASADGTLVEGRLEVGEDIVKECCIGDCRWEEVEASSLFLATISLLFTSSFALSLLSHLSACPPLLA